MLSRCLEPQQEHGGHDRNGNRAFDTAHLFGDVMLAHTHDTLEFFEQQLILLPNSRCMVLEGVMHLKR